MAFDRPHALQPPDPRLWDESDAVLAAQLVAKSQDAFAVIVDRYQRLVFSVAARIVKDAGEAEDVVQNVFLEIFRKAGQFDPSRGTLKVWVLQFAYTRSMNRRHQLEKRQFYSQLELEDVPPFAFATELVQRNRFSQGEAARLVEQALARLNPKQREAIELIYFEGLKFQEAVERTGESLYALRHHYYRGLMKIREVIESTPDARSSQGSEVRIRWEVANAKARAF